jgi:lipocalin
MSVIPNPRPVSFSAKHHPNFLGKWYELARLPLDLPNLSGTDVVLNVTEPKFDVVKIDMTRRVYGLTLRSVYRALILNHKVNTKMYLTSGLVRNWWILRTDCVKYAMIGSPNRKRLSIYSRSSTMERELYMHLLRCAKGMGYDTHSILLTSHKQTFFPSGSLPGVYLPIPEEPVEMNEEEHSFSDDE